MVGEVPHGISAYVTDLARAWIDRGANPKNSITLSFIVQPGVGSRSPWNDFETHECSIPFLSPWEIVGLPKIIRRSNADLFHSPSFSSLVHCPIPWVQTIHDLNHLIFGNGMQKLYYRGLLKRFALKASRLMTVSDFSKNEISSWLSVPAEKIFVVPNAIEKPKPVSPQQTTEALVKAGLSAGKYFLCLANWKVHKNLPFLISAYEASLRDQSHQKRWPLIISAGPNSEFRVPEGVRLLGGLQPAETEILLQGAGALLSPSLYEGFGRPPLEALVRGIPVIASRVPPHQETLSKFLSDSVRLEDPNDLEAWSRALSEAMGGRMKSLSEETRNQILEHWSRDVMGKKVDLVYRSVLGLAL